MIIGIGGISRAGKSMMAETVLGLYPDIQVSELSQDDYVIPEAEIPRIRGEIDWECPESMDFDRFRRALVTAHQRADMVIGEGILVFYESRLNRMFDRRIFITISESTFRLRKVKDLRWGPFPEWYVDHIWESYQKFGTIGNRYRNILVVSGERPFNRMDLRRYIDSGLLL